MERIIHKLQSSEQSSLGGQASNKTNALWFADDWSGQCLCVLDHRSISAPLTDVPIIMHHRPKKSLEQVNGQCVHHYGQWMQCDAKGKEILFLFTMLMQRDSLQALHSHPFVRSEF